MNLITFFTSINRFIFKHPTWVMFMAFAALINGFAQYLRIARLLAQTGDNAYALPPSVSYMTHDVVIFCITVLCALLVLAGHFYTLAHVRHGHQSLLSEITKVFHALMKAPWYFLSIVLGTLSSWFAWSLRFGDTDNTRIALALVGGGIISLALLFAPQLLYDKQYALRDVLMLSFSYAKKGCKQLLGLIGIIFLYALLYVIGVFALGGPHVLGGQAVLPTWIAWTIFIAGKILPFYMGLLGTVGLNMIYDRVRK